MKTRQIVWWQVIPGLLLVFAQVYNWIDPAPNLLRSVNPNGHVGIDAYSIALFLGGVLLLWSGTRPLRKKTRA